MKAGIHPELYDVIFRDVATGDEIVSRSTRKSDDVREVDGKSYFVISCDITSFSHPFYTGKQRLVDSEGRVDRFRRKYGKS